MEYQKLGVTELEISRIGFGCWGIGGHGYGKVDDRESIRAVRKALDLGINFFDTADVYGFGHSEEILSKALGEERKKVIVATKFGVAWDANGKTYKDCSPKRIMEALEGSLKRLRIESIPLYQIHWYDNATPIYEIVDTLKKCQGAGKIQHIGCSNFSRESILQVLKIHPISCLQIPLNILEKDSESDITFFSSEWSIGIIVYEVLGRGLLSGKYNRGSKFGENDTRGRDENFLGERLNRNLQVVEELKNIANRYDKPTCQIALRWVLENDHVNCALTGMKNPKQVEESIGALGWELSEKDRDFISKLV